MLTSIATAIWPLYFVLALGFVAGKRRGFPPDAAREMNKLAVTYALPASLFVATAALSRQTLVRELPALGVVLVSYVSLYLLSAGVVHFGFKRTWPEAGIAGICAASPAGPFFGPAVLPALFGPNSMIAVSIAALVLNLVQNPIALSLIGQGQAQSPAQKRSFLTVARQVVTEPVVWAPVLGIVCAVAGIADPAILAAGFRLIGSTSAGVAIFATGLTLATAGVHLSTEVALEAVCKAVALPALVTGVGLLWGVRGPLLAECIVTGALSSGLLGIMLASQRRVYVAEAASVTLLTSAGLVATLPAWILVANHLAARGP